MTLRSPLRPTPVVSYFHRASLLSVSELLGSHQHGHVVDEQHENKHFLRVVQERVRAEPSVGSQLPQLGELFRGLFTTRGE